MQKIINITAQCPHLRRTHTTSATVEQIVFAGDTVAHAKCVGFYCEYADECTYRESCPLFETANKITDW